MADAATATLPVHDAPVLKALKRMRGRATVGDVSAATGLASAEAEASLRRLLEHRRGHLEVGERGDLVYRFDPGLLERDAVPLGQRIKTALWKGFQVGFKIWIVAMLVIYFLVFVALLLAAMFAGNRDGDGGGWGGGGEGGGHRHRGGLPLGDMLLWYWIWSPGWRHRPYYGEGYGELDRRGRRDRRDRPPFYKKVFAFVFGPDEPVLPASTRDREHLRFIRSRRGVVTATEFVQYSGLGLDEADEELARLMAAHDGDVKVSDDGTLLYLFPSLMVSAHGEVQEREPAPAWRRLEPRKPLTGNSAGTNAAIIGINTFNLLAAATAPLFIFPRLGIGGPAAEVGLIWIPVAFSTLFFAVPALRWLGVTRENTRRAFKNVRKVLLGVVSRFSLGGETADAFPADEAEKQVRTALKDRQHTRVDVTTSLDRLVGEFDGEVDQQPGASPTFRFPGFRRPFEAAHQARHQLRLEGRRVGEIVYSSADDAIEQSERDLRAFDRALADGDPAAGLGAGEPEAHELPGDAGAERRALPPADDLTDYLNDPLRVDFRDERELAVLHERIRAEAGRRAS